MAAKKCVRVTHKKITLVAFEALLEWIYTGSVEIGSGHIGDFSAMKQFCLDPLLSLIDNYGDVKGNAQDAPSGRMVKGQLILDEGTQYLKLIRSGPIWFCKIIALAGMYL